jgi:hypothetical protein
MTNENDEGEVRRFQYRDRCAPVASYGSGKVRRGRLRPRIRDSRR